MHIHTFTYTQNTCTLTHPTHKARGQGSTVDAGIFMHTYTYIISHVFHFVPRMYRSTAGLWPIARKHLK